MLTGDYEQAARLWQRILRTDTKELFGERSSRLLNRNWGDRIAQPGYVGADYSGLVFISMNPGNGKDGLSPEDLKQYAALKRLRGATLAELLPAFRQLNAILAEITPTWKIYRNFVAPILSDAGVRLPEIAYLTLLQWRTVKRSGLSGLYKLCWYAHTGEQMDLLKPKMVIALGKNAGHCFESYGYRAELAVIPRLIGNNIGREGKRCIQQTCKRIRRIL